MLGVTQINFLTILVVTLFDLSSLSFGNQLTYEDARNAVIEAEETISTGGKIVLNRKEQTVNNILMQFKKTELNFGLNNPERNFGAMHFFKAKPFIEYSKVFKFLKKMPKGAVLHAHNTAQVSSDWVIRNITYLPGLLKCINRNGVAIWSFRQNSNHECNTNYVRISDERHRASSFRAYDRELERSINLYTPLPEFHYPYISTVWNKFQNMFATISDAFRYLPVYRFYHRRMLEEMYDDGIMYAELRMSFDTLYDSSGKTYSPNFAVQELIKIVNEFRISHPTFLGVKAIYSTNRKVENVTVQRKIELFKKLYSAYPNFIIGFDLVGQEDLGLPLIDFVDVLRTLPPGAQYFFHAGETNWYGASTDLNILDAVLLNTTRIGHGYALLKHPVLWNAVKNRDIAIEVNPISNQVLNLVWDLRNHPAGFFLSESIPIVISNDDPGLWNAKGVSYDYYYALMSLAPNYGGLKILKQLVWNSIKYSILTQKERSQAYFLLQKSWNRFLDSILAENIV